MINVEFFPYSGGSNPYIDILREGVEADGICKIEEFEIKPLRYLFKKIDTQVVYLNWYDNVQNPTRARTLYSITKRLFLLHTLKRRGIKVYIVLHNRLPHNAKNENDLKKYTKKLMVLADRLVILSNGTKDVFREFYGDKFYKRIENKLLLVPCTHYIGVYKTQNIDFRSKWKINNDEFVFLFWGSIQQYKNIELIIDTARKFQNHNMKAKFVLMGGCKEEYRNELVKKIDGLNNVLLIPRRIEDSELADVIMAASVIILPLDIKSSLNSGTCFVTFSLQKNIVCPRIEGLKDFNEDYFFDYEYTSEEDHSEKLFIAAKQAYDEWNQNPIAYHNREKDIFNELIDNYSGERIGRILSRDIEKTINGR